MPALLLASLVAATLSCRDDGSPAASPPRREVASRREPVRDVATPTTAPIPTQQAAVASAPRVTEAVVARGVKNRAPIGSDEMFLSSVRELWCFTQVVDMPMPDQQAGRWPRIVHVWSRDGADGWAEMARIPLTVKARTWRTWSRKSIRAGDVGRWRVSVEDDQHQVLASVPFEIQTR